MSSSLPPQSDSVTHRCLLDKIFVIFASQTGQAESISEFIFDQFITSVGSLKSIRDHLGEQAVQRFCASKYETLLDDFLLPKNRDTLKPGSYLAIIVASTTGDGDPPDTANKFFRWIRRLKRNGSSEQTLKHLSYALLGLGDTNYDNFANFGHLLDRHFTGLGAKQYVPTEYADDATGLELVTEPFIENLTQTLLEHFGEKQTAISGIWKQSKPEEKSVSDSKLTDNSTATEAAPVEKPSQPETMNIDRPVVSSCACLSSSDKRSLSDLCRQLIEPSEKLREIPFENLALPKIAFAIENGDIHSCLFTGSKMSINETSEDFDKKLISVRDFVKSKVPCGTPFCEAQIKFSRKLSADSESPKLCCHQEKVVIECDVECTLPSVSEENWPFIPGDAFGIYTSNLLADVYQVLTSVFVKDGDHPDDSILLWDYFKVTKKQVYITLSDKTIVELLPYLVFGVDLRTVLKKVALCHFAAFTADEQQKRRLLELSSRQGNLEYQNVILAHKVTACDIFRLFDTCRPPISVFLHYLTAARPRYFSAASLPRDVSPAPVASLPADDHSPTRSFKIIFSVYNNFSHSFMRTSEQLLGLFSGKFFQHYPDIDKTFLPDLSCSNVWKTLELVHSTSTSGSIFDNQDVPMLDISPFPAYVFPRATKSFQITSDISKPLILISAGTGIAPFLSLIEQRKAIFASESSPMGEIYFFFGCRHPYRDFTYAQQIVSHSKGCQPLFKHLCLCFSRTTRVQVAKFEAEYGINLCGHSTNTTENNDTAPVKHVDQLVAIHGKEIVELIVEKGAHTYICGLKKLSTGLSKTFCSLLSEHYLAEEEPSPTSPEAVKYFKELQKSGRYAVDIW